jgi:sRNA-binding protein
MSAKSRRKYWAARSEEIARGWRESREGIAKLRSAWPAAFPEKSNLVRPLALRLVPAIADRMGWTNWYARGVLQGWKARNAYCEAVLRHGQRFNLDGEPVEEVVDDEAKELARQQLARNVKRRRWRREAAAQAAEAESQAAESETAG